MDPGTGAVFNLDSIEDAKLALKKMEAGELAELVKVKDEEIEYLQGLNREDRRKALKNKPALKRRALQDALQRAREAGLHEQRR